MACNKTKVLISWSGGKDSTLALYETVHSERYNVVALVTTVTEWYDRVSIHGLRCDLLVEQARSLGLPLVTVSIPPEASNSQYEAAMAKALSGFAPAGVREVVFGDIYLEDVRRYRDDLLRPLGMKGVFPLWGIPSAQLARRFVRLGFKGRIVCVDPESVGTQFAGMAFDEELLRSLPPGVDPCGERGEFHTFTYDGPLFSRPVRHRTGEVVSRENGLCYCDIQPAP